MSSPEIRLLGDECLSQFDLLCDIIQQTEDPHDRDAANRPKADDQRARFKIWAGHLGVFAPDHASLDHRLRSNEAARSTMLAFLEELLDFLASGDAP